MLLYTKKFIPLTFLHAAPHLSLDCRQHWKKVFLVAFRQILEKNLPVVHIFSCTITRYLKTFCGIKSLSTKECLAELSLGIISPVSPIIPKMFPLLSSCLVSPQCMDCFTRFTKSSGETRVMGGESCPAV